MPSKDSSLRPLQIYTGPLPEQWKGLYTHPKGRDSWYDQDKKPDHSKLAKTIAYYRPDVDPSERELVLSIMLKVFTRIPEERLSATQLLQDPSFRTLMEKYGCSLLYRMWPVYTTSF